MSRARWRATTTDRPPAPALPRSLPDEGGWRWEHALARSTGSAEAPPEPVDVSCKAEPGVTSPQLPDVVAIDFGEPELAIAPHRDAKRHAVRRRDRELGQFVLGSGAEAPNLVANLLSEPEVAIAPRRDASRQAVRRRDRKFGDNTCRGDAPDVVAIHFGELEVAIGPRRDAARVAVRRRDRKFSDFAGERQCGGSSKGHHAAEQAEHPDEQGGTK